jgi:hypothetical protein
VRFGRTELAVLFIATDQFSARSQARELLVLAAAAGIEAWCGYAAFDAGWGPTDLIVAAEADLANARRVAADKELG